MADIEISLLSWIQLFPQHPLSSLSSVIELRDPVVVLKILDQIDPEYFNATTALGIYPEHLRSDKFDVRRTVLSTIYNAMVRYHDVELSGDVKLARLPASQIPNITALAASDTAHSEAVKLGILLILISLLSERKEMFMTMFSELDQDMQTALVIVLNPLLSPEEPLRRSISGELLATPKSTVVKSREIQLEEEISRLLAEKEKSDGQLRQIKDENQKLQYLNNEAEKKVQDLETELVKWVRSKGKDVSAELEEHIATLEGEIKSKRDSLFEQERVIGELSQEIEGCKLVKKENIRLKEESQDDQEELRRLRKVEIVAERYRKKLEHSQDMQTKVRILQEENQMLNKCLEESGEPSETESKVQMLESEKQELQEEIDQLAVNLMEKVKEVEILELHKEEQRVKIEELTGVVGRYEETTEEEDEDDDSSNEVSRLQQRVEELEKEVEALKWKEGPSGHKHTDIRSLIDHYEVLLKVNNNNNNNNPNSSNKRAAIESKRIPSGSSNTSSGTPKPKMMTISEWKDEAQRSQAEVEHLKRELVLMSSAWHSLASRVQQRSVTVMKRAAENPQGWLNKQRKALERLAMRSEEVTQVSVEESRP